MDSRSATPEEVVVEKVLRRVEVAKVSCRPFSLSLIPLTRQDGPKAARPIGFGKLQDSARP